MNFSLYKLNHYYLHSTAELKFFPIIVFQFTNIELST